RPRSEGRSRSDGHGGGQTANARKSLGRRRYRRRRNGWGRNGWGRNGRRRSRWAVFARRGGTSWTAGAGRYQRARYGGIAILRISAPIGSRDYDEVFGGDRGRRADQVLSEARGRPAGGR